MRSFNYEVSNNYFSHYQLWGRLAKEFLHMSCELPEGLYEDNATFERRELLAVSFNILALSHNISRYSYYLCRPNTAVLFLTIPIALMNVTTKKIQQLQNQPGVFFLQSSQYYLLFKMLLLRKNPLSNCFSKKTMPYSFFLKKKKN